MAQYGGPPGWLEESYPAGVILYVMDGPYCLPFPYRTAVVLTGAAQLRAHVHNHPPWATSRKEGMAWYSSRTIRNLLSMHRFFAVPYRTVHFLSFVCSECIQKASSLKMNTALEYSTRVVQEGGRRCKKSTLNDLVHLTPLRIPLMNPPKVFLPMPNCTLGYVSCPLPLYRLSFRNN